ncbi:polyphosphate polymerase domain-containing protein [Oceanobacillus profundus]|uniref:Polyphosphate polymerase domain-containing protein n=1 Tax=Oceanobacillus profundus TaxID=372463 RepID=A0A417YHZ2_9BACI|nr:polyphosphate polymerase domain-containing protein [Oceanobacillus profundus]MCM3398906.1 polyphosphate polymerase domain-containing protein [Oceanobacillus profundus]RHW32502.1 polyphosphate polymerase domain-containing protein [Oceanobacillus profundus]
MAIEIFRRKEQKYLITTVQYELLIQQISPFMRPDKFGEDGKYTVTSLYFESDDHKIYFETKNKLKYRQKLRLRIYDDTDIHGTAFFEVKQKHKKVVNKRRMLISLSEAYRYINRLESCINNYEGSNIQVLREIDYFRNLYRLEPEMIVSYDRHALHCITDPELRITFDSNLRCRNEDLLLENGAYGKNFVDSNLVVLEVKVNDSVPLWLTRILQQLNCEQRSASKFCTSLELLKNPPLPNGKENVTVGGV